jgi:hypothetical protein
MTIRQIQIIAPTALTATAVAYAIVPASNTYRIGRAGFANSSGGPVSVSAYLVKPGGTPSAANEILPPTNVANGTTYVSPELAGLTMPAGTSLWAAGAGVVLYASGVSVGQ